MKNYFMYAFVLLFSQVSLAEDLCFEIECPDCANYPAQHLRIIDLGPATFSGYVQANDDSWGYPAITTIKGGSFVFASYRGNSQYLFDVDLTTYDGSIATGTRYHTQFSLKDGEIKKEYTPRSEKQIQLVSRACP